MSKTDPKDKLAMVLDATEHPEQYTDEQLEELLRDEECAAYYRLMSEASSAFAETHTESEEEIDAEWQRIDSPQGGCYHHSRHRHVGHLIRCCPSDTEPSSACARAHTDSHPNSREPNCSDNRD